MENLSQLMKAFEPYVGPLTNYYQVRGAPPTEFSLRMFSHDFTLCKTLRQPDVTGGLDFSPAAIVRTKVLSNHVGPCVKPN